MIHIDNITNPAGGQGQPTLKHLNTDQLSDFIFKELKIKESDCIGLDYLYDLKEIELKTTA